MMYRGGMDVAEVPDLHWLEAKIRGWFFGYCSLEGRLKTLMMYRSGMDVADVPDLFWLEAKA